MYELTVFSLLSNVIGSPISCTSTWHWTIGSAVSGGRKRETGFAILFDLPKETQQRRRGKKGKERCINNKEEGAKQRGPRETARTRFRCTGEKGGRCCAYLRGVTGDLLPLGHAGVLQGAPTSNYRPRRCRTTSSPPPLLQWTMIAGVSSFLSARATTSRCSQCCSHREIRRLVIVLVVCSVCTATLLRGCHLPSRAIVKFWN